MSAADTRAGQAIRDLERERGTQIATNNLPQSIEGRQALPSSGGLVGDGGSPRGNTKLARQGLAPLSLGVRTPSFSPTKEPSPDDGMDAPGGVGGPSLDPWKKVGIVPGEVSW